MIEMASGNILTCGAEALVNPVNCVGVMGKGLALEFKRAFPENFTAYKAACQRGEVKVGRPFVFGTGAPGPRFIINFPTKKHWRGKSDLLDVLFGISRLKDVVCNHGVRSIAIPALGCGLGGLNWDDVRPALQANFGGLPGVRVLLFPPGG